MLLLAFRLVREVFFYEKMLAINLLNFEKWWSEVNFMATLRFIMFWGDMLLRNDRADNRDFFKKVLFAMKILSQHTVPLHGMVREQ